MFKGKKINGVVTSLLVTSWRQLNKRDYVISENGQLDRVGEDELAWLVVSDKVAEDPGT